MQEEFGAEINFINPDDIFSHRISLSDGQLDLVIYDLNTSPGFGSVPKNVQKINKGFPAPPVLILHSYDHEKFTQPLLEAGASGIISITPTEDELMEAVKQILSGNIYISSSKNKQ